MRKLFLAIALCCFVFSATELHQLIKLPHLFAHYNEHKETDQTITIIHFLVLHYTADHPNDNDDNDDQELPFKSIEKINHGDNVMIEKNNCITVISKLRDAKIKTFHPEGFVSNRANEIFRPPRCT